MFPGAPQPDGSAQAETTSSSTRSFISSSRMLGRWPISPFLPARLSERARGKRWAPRAPIRGERGRGQVARRPCATLAHSSAGAKREEGRALPLPPRPGGDPLTPRDLSFLLPPTPASSPCGPEAHGAQGEAEEADRLHDGLGDGRHSPVGAPRSRVLPASPPRDGADGTRTRDLLAASQTLSQLSYGPVRDSV